MKIKLVHLYGYVSCKDTPPNHWSPWGCGYHPEGDNAHYEAEWTGIYVTTASDTVLFPPKEIGLNKYHWALIPGYNSRSPELVMSIYDTPVSVTAGQELRLWYSDDYENQWEYDNHGRVCADVYGYFM